MRAPKQYSEFELVQIAEDYAQKMQITFDFAKAGRCIWIHTEGSNVMATVVFHSGFGTPLYSADIDWSGKVLTNFLGVAHD